MFSLFKRRGSKNRKVKISMTREIIVIAVILIISVVLSLPQFREDMEKLRIWNEINKDFQITEQSEK